MENDPAKEKDYEKEYAHGTYAVSGTKRWKLWIS